MSGWLYILQQVSSLILGAYCASKYFCWQQIQPESERLTIYPTWLAEHLLKPWYVPVKQVFNSKMRRCNILVGVIERIGVR